MGPLMYYSVLGISRTIQVFAEACCTCRRLEYDQHPENHVDIIVQKTCKITRSTRRSHIDNSTAIIADNRTDFWNQTMQYNARSIRPFIGARNFEMSRQFYRDLGFEESVVSNDMSFFKTDGLGFYLQDAYVKDWIDNTMLFLEVDNVERHWTELKALDLPARYENVRLTSIRTEHWGKECFLHDPSGILWHFGEFCQ